jgi:hypothetical protein
MDPDISVTFRMTPDAFVKVLNYHDKVMALDEVMEKGYDFFPEISMWIQDVLLKERETSLFDAGPEEQGAELILRLVQAVGKDVHEDSAREILGGLYLESNEGKALFYVIERILIVAIDDELAEVRDWSLNLLTKSGRIADPNQIEELLIEIVKGNFPYYLKEVAITTLAKMGTEEGVRTLTNFAKTLLTVQSKSLYEKTKNNLLKREIAYGLGITRKANVMRTLTALKLFSEDPDVKEAANHAIKRTERSERSIDPKIVAVGSAGKRSEFPKKSISDDSKNFEFQVVLLPSGRARITLEKTSRHFLPDAFKLKIFTSLQEKPTADCTIEKRDENFEYYGYIDTQIEIGSIVGIEVLE